MHRQYGGAERQCCSLLSLDLRKRCPHTPLSILKEISVLKEISPECSLEGLMLKLKLQYLLWPSDAKNQLTGKDPDAGKDRRQEEKGTSEDDEMVGWHH